MKIEPGKPWRIVGLDTFGWVAIACLFVCMLSGVFLAIPFDIGDPYLSITRFVTANPYASFMRNLHYWSAQFFMLFVMIHLVDHLRLSSENNIRSHRTWAGLSFSIIFLFYVMISGFILRADPAGQQALAILSYLIETIPLFGHTLKLVFIGYADSLQLVYVHHVATATLILIFVIYDHIHSLWVKLPTFLYTLLIISTIGWLFPAPLMTMQEDILKGPWYFVGMQEALHWLSKPVIIVISGLILLALLYLVYPVNSGYKKVIKRLLFIFLILYTLLTITGYFFRGADWRWQWPGDTAYSPPMGIQFRPILSQDENGGKLFSINGSTEGCMSCHSEMKGLSPSHNIQTTGCYACHRGDPFTLNKSQAHRGMEMVPGNLSNASQTCGSASCHADIAERLPNSMMARLNGMISVDRYVFGESQKLDGTASVNDLGYSAADQHLRQLCAGCHLGNEKLKPGTPQWLERGGGCNACHLTYDKNAEKDLSLMQEGKSGKEHNPAFHPAIDLNIGNDKCLSCHSRSGRISLSYEGWHETEVKEEGRRQKAEGNERKDKVKMMPGEYRVLPDNRELRFVGADVHHERGLSCIDCHGSYELMGDQQSHFHKEDAVSVACTDCHSKEKPTTRSLASLDRESQRVAGLSNVALAGGQRIVTKKGQRALVNAWLDDDDSTRIMGKINKRLYTGRPPAIACSEGRVHDRLNCSACHTAWVPQCLGCHNSYEKKTFGWDMLKQEKTKGAWVEYAGSFIAGPPPLGVRGNEIITVTPGMNLSIDKASFDKKLKNTRHRLYAPASGHTTQTKGRSCKSCHNDPLALGYGRGILTYSVSGSKGRWEFEPEYAANRQDGLPEDAWTGFLQDASKAKASRSNLRPFSVEEQRKILTIGACLHCHKEDSRVVSESLYNFQGLKRKLSDQCAIPIWK